MQERLRTLLSPLNFAAYLAWGAIGWELLFTRWDTPGWLGAPPPAWLLGALHLAFLGLFMSVVGHGREVTGWPVGTIIRGHTVMWNGEIIGQAPGQPIRFVEAL